MPPPKPFWKCNQGFFFGMVQNEVCPISYAESGHKSRVST